MIDVIMIGPFPEDPAFIKGGVQASVYGLSKALLLQPGIRSVQVVASPIKATTEPVRMATVEGLKVTYLNAPYRFLVSSIVHLPHVLRLVKGCTRPVVHIHGTGLFQFALLASLRLLRVGCVWTLHGITEKETLQRYRERQSLSNFGRYLLYRFLERTSLRITPFIIVDTPYVREAIPPVGAPVHVIPQGIFTQEFKTAATRDPNLILSLGVLDPRKGHHLTLQAFDSLRNVLPHAKLVIAGAPTTPSYIRSLQEQVKALGLESRVEIAINRPRGDIVAWLGSARILALHSQEESQGIALCEALAAGLPIVATRVGGIPFVVGDGKDGLLVSYGDVTGFAECMTHLLTDNQLCAQMSEQAHRSARRFDWNQVAAEVVALYDKAMVRH
jgi:glycosyltransferase involved in cell wall biosynthesis